MMRALRVRLALDVRQAVRHRFVHVVIGVASAFGALLRFVVPSDIERPLPWDEIPRDIPPHHVLTALGPITDPPPFDLALVPLMLGLDVVMLGFLFGGVMVLQEKMDGTVGAYRVGPGGTAPFVLSKLLVNVLLGALNAAVFLAWAHPAALLSPGLVLLVLGVTTTLTLFGMGLASFFDSLSSFFYPLAVVGLVLNLPMLAYVSPSLDLAWLAWVPTWDVMFVGRALLFDPASVTGVATVAVRILLGLALMGAFATWAIDRRLLKESA